MEEATKVQKRIIRKLSLENIVPLNVSPEKVDNEVLGLLLNGKIDAEIHNKYFCSNARQSRVYVPTICSTIKNNLYSLFAR